MFMVQTQVLICAFLNNWININESTPLNGKKGNMKCSKEKQLKLRGTTNSPWNGH